MILIIPYLIVVVSCAALSYALTFAFFQRNWPSLDPEKYRLEDLSIAIRAAFIAGLIPPFVLIVLALADGGKHGLKWK